MKQIIKELEAIGFRQYNSHLPVERANNPQETDSRIMLYGKFRAFISSTATVIISIHDRSTNRYIVLNRDATIADVKGLVKLIDPRLKQYPMPEPIRELTNCEAMDLLFYDGNVFNENKSFCD